MGGGVATQRKGHGETAGKQRSSGECSASEDNAAKTIIESRMTMADVSMANKKKGD